MNVVFISLGGNMGKREVFLNLARNLISQKMGTITKLSAIYETEAWGTTSEKKYLNQIIKISSKLNADVLIATCLQIEQELGRKRGKRQYANRTIDIDILFYNNEIITSKNLNIPHPKITERKFILTPLCEIEPSFIHPSHKKSLKELLKICNDELKVVKTNFNKANVRLNYICIEGNIGSGKSTLAIAFAKKIKANYLPELFLENDLLPLFYKNPKKYAFLLEYSFLLSRYNQIIKAFKQQKKCVVSDYSFYKCLWFAKINLPNKDFKLFEKHFYALLETLPKPDVIIKLNTTTKNLLKNINSRNRKFENTISANYLEKINNAYLQGSLKLKDEVVFNMFVKEYSTKLTALQITDLSKLLNV